MTFTQYAWLCAIPAVQVWSFESSTIGARAESFNGAILVFDSMCQHMGTFAGLQFSWPAPLTPTELDFGGAWAQCAPPLVASDQQIRLIHARKTAVSEIWQCVLLKHSGQIGSTTI